MVNDILLPFFCNGWAKTHTEACQWYTGNDPKYMFINNSAKQPIVEY